MNDVWRLFAAIELPDPVRERIARVSAHLARAGWRARWVNPEGSHLTLKFYGNVPTTRIPALRSALRAAVTGHGSLLLQTDGMGVFPNARRPRVVWIGVRGDVDRLVSLQRAIDDASVALGFPPEERAYHPHVTVARIRPEDLGTIRELERHFVDLRSLPPLPIPIERVTLFRSELRPTGALYSVVDECPLGGNR